MKEEKKYLLFDGDCGLCTAFADWTRRRDRAQKFDVISYQAFSEEELQRRGTSREKCAQRLHVLLPAGRFYRGAWALNYFAWHFFPWKIFVLIIYALPVFLLAEILAYELVARHRQRLSRWLGLQACVMPQAARAASAMRQ